MIVALDFVFGVGLSLMVLLTTLLHVAARVDQVVDPESALLWRETASKGLKWLHDVHQNEHGSTGVDGTASVAANA